jgi:hypothetical protein
MIEVRRLPAIIETWYLRFKVIVQMGYKLIAVRPNVSHVFVKALATPAWTYRR